MKTEWDYTLLADAYLKRPDYSDDAIDKMLAIAGVQRYSSICDVGAGVAHLTLMLAKRGMNVVAVEPNDAMRENGKKRTAIYSNIKWYEGTGEATGQPSSVFDMVTFGSSFNVADRPIALKETARILKPKGWFACMWNHRNLNDPIQNAIETIIQTNVPDYSYGTRREDQTSVIKESGLFDDVRIIEGETAHDQAIQDIVEAWRSHATFKRQACGKFDEIIGQIDKMLTGLGRDKITIPYTTRIWMAQLL